LANALPLGRFRYPIRRWLSADPQPSTVTSETLKL
jgi:hypothetical protein